MHGGSSRAWRASRVTGAAQSFYRAHVTVRRRRPSRRDARREPTRCRTSDASSRVRVVLVRTSHAGEHRRGGARDATRWALRDSRSWRRRAFPMPTATALASGATAVLDRARVVPTLDEALAGRGLSIGLSARPREFAGRVMPLRAAPRRGDRHGGDGDVALVFGTEMSGLTNDELARCTAVATIAANPAIARSTSPRPCRSSRGRCALRRWATASWSAPRSRRRRTTRSRRCTRTRKRTLIALRFLDPARPRRLMPRLRRLFARAGLEREEVNILRGILARIDALTGTHDDR